MADEFDSLMSGYGAGALGALSAFAGGVRRENEAREAQQQQLGFQALQALSQERIASQQNRLIEQQLAAQQIQSEREMALRREESAFSRLNESLRTQMEFTDRETARRNEAFQNSMRAELFAVEMQTQAYQLREVERSMAAKDFLGAAGGLMARMYTGHYDRNLGKFGEDLSQLMSENTEAMSFLMATPEGRAEIQNFNSQIRASQLVPTRVPKLSLISGSGDFNEGEINELAANLKLSGKLNPDDQQALGYLVQRALGANTFENQSAGTDLGLDATSEDADLEVVLAYAEAHKEVPHWANLRKELNTPRGRTRFLSMHRAGALSPVKDTVAVEKLNMLAQSEMNELAEMLSITGGRYLTSSEYKDARRSMERDYENARIDIISGGDPVKSWVMKGGTDFDARHKVVMEEADKSRVFGDVLEATGLAGAGRAVRSVFTGEKVSGSDWADLGLTALMFVPGVGLVTRGVLGAGKFAVGTAARVVGRGATMRAGGREAVAQGFARTRAALGARTAAQTLSRQAAPGAAAYTPATLRAVAQQTTGRAFEGTRSLPELLKIYAETSAKAKTGATWAARRGAEKKLPALQRAISDASAASVQELNLANAAARATAAARIPGAQAAFREAIPGAARELTGAAAFATQAARGLLGRSDFYALNEAKEKVESSILALQMRGEDPNTNVAIIKELNENLDNYKAVASRYFKDGKLKPAVEEQLFDLRDIIPRSVAETIQMNYLRRIDPGGAGSRVLSNEDIRMKRAMQQMTARMQSGRPAPPNATAGGELSNSGGYNWSSTATD